MEFPFTFLLEGDVESPMQEAKEKTISFWLALLGGSLQAYITLSVAIFITFSEQYFIPMTTLTFAVFLICFLYLAQSKKTKELINDRWQYKKDFLFWQLNFSEIGIEYKHPRLEYPSEENPAFLTINWEDIQSLKKTPSVIEVIKKNGKKYSLSIVDISYSKHQQLKKVIADVQQFVGVQPKVSVQSLEFPLRFALTHLEPMGINTFSGVGKMPQSWKIIFPTLLVTISPIVIFVITPLISEKLMLILYPMAILTFMYAVLSGRAVKYIVRKSDIEFIKEERHIVFTDKGLRYHNSDDKATTTAVLWNDMKELKKGTKNLEITLRNKKEITISLGDISYNQHQELKKIVADVQKFITA